MFYLLVILIFIISMMGYYIYKNYNIFVTKKKTDEKYVKEYDKVIDNDDSEVDIDEYSDIENNDDASIEINSLFPNNENVDKDFFNYSSTNTEENSKTNIYRPQPLNTSTRGVFKGNPFIEPVHIKKIDTPFLNSTYSIDDEYKVDNRITKLM